MGTETGRLTTYDDGMETETCYLKWWLGYIGWWLGDFDYTEWWLGEFDHTEW